MGGGKSIFSDLDTYIEETEDPDVREPKREGNIQKEGSRPENPQNEGNIGSEGAKPRPPNRSPIDPSEGPKQDIDKENIPKSPNAPEEPQRKGNIQPREFNRESGEIEGNIQPDGDTQPRGVDKTGNIKAEDDQPQGAQTEGNIEADDSQTPEDPRSSGNFPSREGNQPNAPNREGVINLRDFAEPEGPQNEGNIGSREDNEPDAPTRNSNISSQEENQPSEPSTEGNIGPREDNQPQEPNFGISTEEDNRPREPNTDGNIQADGSAQPPEPETGDIQTQEDNRPQEPNRDESIQAQEDNQPREPGRAENIQADDSARPREPSTEDNIEGREDNQPQEPSRDENIEADDDVQPPEFQSKGGTGLIERRSTRDLQPDDRAEERPADANTEGNIEAQEDNQPQEPSASGNIEAENERQPQGPSTEGNVTPRPENEPEEPQTEDNIEGREENEPERPQVEGNIEDEEENQPQRPQTEGNIEGREENEPSPPQGEDNIENREENEPGEPQAEGNIEDRDENQPQRPQTEGNIEGREENEPQGPETEGNIEDRDENQPDEPRIEGNIGDREENEPEEPQGEGNIEDREENEPSAPQRDRNIEGRDENRPQRPQTEGNIEADDDAQPREVPGLDRRGAEDDIDRLNEQTRTDQFDEFFDFGGRFDQPFILRRPEAGGGSPFTANIKQGDSRTAPAASTAEDVTRLSKFQATAEGQLFNVKQQFLQSFNPRERTRIYDPTSITQTASAGLASRPGLGVTRHLTATSGPFGAVGRAAEGIGNVAGFDVPTSARFEQKLDDEAIETSNFGTLRGSLIFSSPVVRGVLPNVSGELAQQEVRNRISNNIQDLQPLFTTTGSPNFEKFATAALSSAGNVINSYLFTKSYDPQGGPDSEGREETDTFHPGLTYIQNVETVGDRSSVNPEDFEPADFSEVAQELLPQVLDARRTERQDTSSSFPYIDPRRTPAQSDVGGGEGEEVSYQIQNESSTPDVFHENRVVSEGGINAIPLHRGIQNSDRSRGLPNYSVKNETGDRINRTDLVNRLEPLINTEGVDEGTDTFGSEANQFEDVIPFRFWDIENDAAIVFRAFLNGISDNLSPQWNQKDYAGRPEQAHIYSGYSNSVSFDFQVAPFTQEEFAANWKKVNYLKGLTTPASYSRARGGGEFMVPPYLRLQIGDLFNDLFGYFNSLTISVDDDASWEIDRSRGGEEIGRLPKILEVSVDFQVIPERFPAAGQKYYDAPFIDEVDQGTIVGDGIEPSGDPVLDQDDDAQRQRQRRIDVDNAVETIKQQTEDINAPTDD